MSGNEDMLSLLGSPWSLITRVSEIRWPHAYSFNTLLARWQKVVPLRSSNNQRNGYRAFRSNLWIQMGSRSYTKRDASYSSLRTPSSGVTLGLIGVLVSWSQHRRRSREVAASWQLYVTDRSFVYTIVDSGHPSTIRIPLAHIKAVSVNEPLAECGPATCLCSTGPDAVVVTLKREYRSQYGARCSGRLAFRYAENADEFADAVRRQMSAGSYWVLQAHWTAPF